MGDINIDTDSKTAAGKEKLAEFSDIFYLEKLIKGSTCEIVRASTIIDINLTNKKCSFKGSGTLERGISDHHKMTLTIMRANYEKLKPNKIKYTCRSYKNFSLNLFLNDITKIPFHKCSK